MDIAWLAAFRVLFGLTMCVSMLRFIGYGWVDRLFVAPRFHFKYWGFEWVDALSPSATHGLFWALAGLSLAMAAGLLFRVTSILFVAAFSYLMLIDVTNYLNHYYLAALLGALLAVSPAGRAWSVDAWLGVTQPADGVARLWLWLFRFQVGVVYAFAGLAKATPDWLLDGQPLRIWLAGRTDLPVIGAFLAQDWAAPLMSWSGFLFDTTIVCFLLVAPVRPFAFAAVIVFHALTRVLFPIGMFPFIMVLGALVFFSPGWPRLWLRWLPRTGTLARPASLRWPRVGLALAAVWMLFHVAMPLRFLAYGGNVLWHEQGMRFSWRVMVREKNAAVTFIVREASGRVRHVSAREYLTPLQEREMGGQPDLILQLAHRIAADFPGAEVRVDAPTSLNGRRAALLVDPTRDLAQVDDGLGRADWILPAPTGRAPHLRPVH